VNKTAVLVFGLDGATWKLLGPWLEEGKLPFLSSLVARGSCGTLKSTFPPLTSTAWVSFQTGVSSATHGILGFIKDNGHLFSAQDIAQPTFWEIAARQGKSAAIINMPLSYPPKAFRGCLVTSFLTPPGKAFAYPPSLQRELIKLGYQTNIQFERYFFLKNGQLSDKEKRTIKQDIRRLIRLRQMAAQHIIQKESWDLVFVLFKCTDLAQHLFWRSEETLKVYQQIDAAMKSLTEEYRQKNPSRQINILVVSDHGFHPVAKKDICLYPLLVQLGLLPPVPRWWLKILRGLRKITKMKIFNRFAYPTKIKITDFGVGGITTPQKLKEKLSKITLDKHHVFAEIKVVKQKGGKFPQLLWITNPYFAPNADPLSEKLTYPRQSHFKARHHSDRNGIFIASGPQVKKSCQKVTLDIVDIPVSILRLLGVTPPTIMEGKARKEVFSFPRISLQKRVDSGPKKTTSSLTKKEEKIIINRLKALGYVD